MAWGKNKLNEIIKNGDEKGKIAEAIVEDFLLEKGFEVFITSDSHSHLCDGYAILKNNLNRSLYYDVKSKQVRNLYKDTGIDYKEYKKYIKFINETGKPFFIFFVDEELKKVYFFDLRKANNENMFNDKSKFKFYKDEDEIVYPKLEDNNKYIYFSLEQMKLVRDLTEEEIFILKEWSKKTGKNYTYNIFNSDVVKN